MEAGSDPAAAGSALGLFYPRRKVAVSRQRKSIWPRGGKPQGRDEIFFRNGTIVHIMPCARRTLRKWQAVTKGVNGRASNRQGRGLCAPRFAPVGGDSRRRAPCDLSGRLILGNLVVIVGRASGESRALIP